VGRTAQQLQPAEQRLEAVVQQMLSIIGQFGQMLVQASQAPMELILSQQVYKDPCCELVTVSVLRHPAFAHPAFVWRRRRSRCASGSAAGRRSRRSARRRYISILE